MYIEVYTKRPETSGNRWKRPSWKITEIVQFNPKTNDLVAYGNPGIAFGTKRSRVQIPTPRHTRIGLKTIVWAGFLCLRHLYEKGQKEQVYTQTCILQPEITRLTAPIRLRSGTVRDGSVKNNVREAARASPGAKRAYRCLYATHPGIRKAFSNRLRSPMHRSLGAAFQQ